MRFVGVVRSRGCRFLCGQTDFFERKFFVPISRLTDFLGKKIETNQKKS